MFPNNHFGSIHVSFQGCIFLGGSYKNIPCHMHENYGWNMVRVQNGGWFMYIHHMRKTHTCHIPSSTHVGQKMVKQKDQVDVSENSGTPKSSILIGFSIINHPFWGTLIFGNTHIFSPEAPELDCSTPSGVHLQGLPWGDELWQPLVGYNQHGSLKFNLCSPEPSTPG